MNGKTKARDVSVDDVPTKKAKHATRGPMYHYLSVQQQISDASCDFVRKNASCDPQGFKVLGMTKDALMAAMKEAVTLNDFDSAKRIQNEYNEVLSRCDFERKLYGSAVASLKYATSKLTEAKKRLQMDRCKYYHSVIKTCNQYLDKVPDDDKVVDSDDDKVVDSEGASEGACSEDEGFGDDGNNDGDDGNDDGNNDGDDGNDTLPDSQSEERLSSKFQIGKKSKAGRSRSELKNGSGPRTMTTVVVNAPKKVKINEKVTKVQLEQLLRRTRVPEPPIMISL